MSGSRQEETKVHLNSIEDALEDIKNGKIIIVVDDEDRENEGDFVSAAELTSPEQINFMATHCDYFWWNFINISYFQK